MHQCKSGQHWWTRQSDADKCCNGWHRELCVAQVTLGETLPADATGVRYESGAMIGRVWVQDTEETPGA